MKDSRAISTVSLILIGALLLQTIGCTTSRVVTDVRTCRNKEITVKTRDRRVFQLTTWRLDKEDNIVGKGALLLPSERYGIVYQAYSGTLSKYDIASVEEKEIEAGWEVWVPVVLIGGVAFLYSKFSSAVSWW